MKKIKVLISHNDLDGYGANILFHIAFDIHKNENQLIYNFDNGSDIEIGIELVLMNIEKMIKYKPEYTFEIFIVDICPNHENLSRLASIDAVERIYIFDHHLTNKEKTVGIDKVEVDIRTTGFDENGNEIVACGTSIFYDYLRKGCPWSVLPSHVARKCLDLLVKYITWYDTYEWKNKGDEGLLCKELNTFFGMFENKLEFVIFFVNQIKDSDDVLNIAPISSDTSQPNKYYLHLMGHTTRVLINQKIAQEQKLIDQVLDNPDAVYKGKIIGHPTKKNMYNAVYYIHDDRLGSISELAHQYLTKYNDIDVFVGINLHGKEIGFRTIRDDINTAELFAKPAGGGGHPKASGFKMSIQYISNIVNMITRDTKLSYIDKYNDIISHDYQIEQGEY